MAAKLIGIEKVMKNLNKEVVKLEAKSMKGLITSAILIRRDMEQTSPKIPVDLGNLRASFFIVTKALDIGSGPSFKGDASGKLQAEHGAVVSEVKSKVPKRQPTVVMGFSANYAWFVHENVDASFKRPGSGAKFFEASLKRNSVKILEILNQNMSRK